VGEEAFSSTFSVVDTVGDLGVTGSIFGDLGVTGSVDGDLGVTGSVDGDLGVAGSIDVRNATVGDFFSLSSSVTAGNAALGSSPSTSTSTT